MKWDVLNIKGDKIKSIDIPEEIFGLEMNEAVLHTVVKASLANKRQGTHATKTRSMVSGGGKKPFRQKGTGSARQGHGRSPLFPGGAVVHGPQPRDYTQVTNKKVRQLAMKVALSDKVKHNKLIIVDDFAVSKYSTKEILAALNAVGAGKTSLLSDERKDDLLYKSTRNIHGSVAVSPMEMNVEGLLRHEALVISENAVNTLKARLGGK